MLAPIISPTLSPFQHGFFTRHGGVSTGIYEGLNCGPGSNDAPSAVTENRARVAAWFGVEPNHLLSVHQVHSADVIHVTEPITGDRPRCDAMVTSTAGIALGVLSADCAPILFADPANQVIGAAHSGWRGTFAGLGNATVEAMIRLGAKRSEIRAVIGPTISQQAYEVGPEFVEQFLSEDPAHARFFSGGKGDRAQFDLPSFLLAHLRDTGIHSAEWVAECTFSDPKRLFSYRRTSQNGEPDYGRLISAIKL